MGREIRTFETVRALGMAKSSLAQSHKAPCDPRRTRRFGRVNGPAFRKIRPTLQRAGRASGPPFDTSWRDQVNRLRSYVDVMHHTVSNVIHSQCCQAAML